MKTTLERIQLISGDLFEKKILKKNDYLVKQNVQSRKLACIEEGILRGFITNEKGEDINILFFRENDFVSGSLQPNQPSGFNVQAIVDCTLHIADFERVATIIRNHRELSAQYDAYINSVHARIQKRLIALLDSPAIDKYRYFLEEYPNLINRIPHYYVAGFLGITPTQLSRIRKDFVKKA